MGQAHGRLGPNAKLASPLAEVHAIGRHRRSTDMQGAKLGETIQRHVCDLATQIFPAKAETKLDLGSAHVLPNRLPPTMGIGTHAALQAP